MTFMKIVEYIKPTKLRSPVLIQGLPGVSLVGKIAVTFLISQFKPKLLAKLYSEYLTLSNGALGVYVKSESDIDSETYDLYLLSLEERDLILLTSDVQPVSWGQYKVANEILDYMKKLNVKEVITLGGNVVLKPEDTVYACARDLETLEYLKKYNVNVLEGGEVTGACGLMAGMAILKGMNAICLLSSTKGTHPDPAASKRLLKILDAMFNMKISYKEIDKAIYEINKTLKIRAEMEKILEKVRIPERKEELPYHG